MKLGISLSCPALADARAIERGEEGGVRRVDGDSSLGAVRAACAAALRDALDHAAPAVLRAAQESEIPNFKGSDLGHFPLVSADFWTSDHLSGRSRSVDAFVGTRARGTPTLKRR